MRIFWRIMLASMIGALILPLVVILLWCIAKNWPWPELWPDSFGDRGISYILDPVSKTASITARSMGLSLFVMLVSLIIGVPAAKALGCSDFKGKQAVHMFILTPLIVPPLTVAMGIHVSFIRLGLANTFWGVALIHVVSGIPYAIRILANVFEIIGDRMETQAMVLGASRFQAARYVTLPLIAPGLAAAGLMVFIVSFSQYFLTFFIGGGSVVTLPMVMFPYMQSGDRMMASVYSVSFMAVALGVMVAVESLVRRMYAGSDYHYLSDI